MLFYGNSHLVGDLKDYNYVINDGVDICTQLNGPFVLEPKCSSMVGFQQISFVMLFGLGGP